MKLSGFRFVGGAGLLLAASVIMAAESINPPTNLQVPPMNAQEKKNLDMVMTWWREVLYAGHLDLAPTLAHDGPPISVSGIRCPYLRFYSIPSAC